MTPRHVLVLGAGPAGLAFAYCYGAGARILEQDQRVGGLSKSLQIRDGVFDLGGHSFHTPHKEVADLIQQLMNNNWHQQTRDARVWFNGEQIPYPFQHHYTKLNNATITNDCQDHHYDSTSTANSKNLKEWMYNRFGSGITQHFMLPYNQKLWAHNLEEISCEWVDQRIATTQELQRHNQTTRQPLQTNSTIGYPLEGGFGRIYEELASHCKHIQFEQKVTGLDPKKKTLTTEVGSQWPWETIVSTLPITHLLSCIKPCPNEMIQLAEGLQAVSLKILCILAKRISSTVPQRIYIADPNIPPHKVAFNHTSSPALLARQHHAITCEISYSKTKPALADPVLTQRSIAWLIDAGFVQSVEDVVETRIVDLPYGYPINTQSTTKIIKIIQTFLKTHNIHSIGRFGAWQYANSDECVRQGLDLARHLKQSVST